MNLLPPLEHLDELFQPPLTRLLFLRLAEAVDDRVAVGAVEGRKELACGGSGIQLPLQVCGDLGDALALVGVLPATVGLRRLDLGQSSRAHPPGLDQPFCLLAVDPRPATARTARREALQEVLIVEGPLLAVDPAEAEHYLEGLRIADALQAGAHFGDLQPDPGGARPLPLQPTPPLARRSEQHDWKLIRHSVGLCRLE